MFLPVSVCLSIHKITTESYECILVKFFRGMQHGQSTVDFGLDIICV